MVLSNNLSLCQLFALIFCLSLKSDGSPAPGSELRTNTIMWYSSQRPIILPGVALCQYYSWHTRNVNIFYTKYICITVSLLKLHTYFWLLNPAYCIFRSRSIVLTTQDHYLRSIPWITPDWWPQGLVSGDIRWWGPGITQSQCQLVVRRGGARETPVTRVRSPGSAQCRRSGR